MQRTLNLTFRSGVGVSAWWNDTFSALVKQFVSPGKNGLSLSKNENINR